MLLGLSLPSSKHTRAQSNSRLEIHRTTDCPRWLPLRGEDGGPSPELARSADLSAEPSAGHVRGQVRRCVADGGPSPELADSPPSGPPSRPPDMSADKSAGVWGALAKVNKKKVGSFG